MLMCSPKFERSVSKVDPLARPTSVERLAYNFGLSHFAVISGKPGENDDGWDASSVTDPALQASIGLRGSRSIDPLPSYALYHPLNRYLWLPIEIKTIVNR